MKKNKYFLKKSPERVIFWFIKIMKYSNKIMKATNSLTYNKKVEYETIG